MADDNASREPCVRTKRLEPADGIVDERREASIGFLPPRARAHTAGNATFVIAQRRDALLRERLGQHLEAVVLPRKMCRVAVTIRRAGAGDDQRDGNRTGRVCGQKQRAVQRAGVGLELHRGFLRARRDGGAYRHTGGQEYAAHNV